MANYKIHPSADVKQLDAGTHSAVTATSTVLNGGTAKGLGANRTLLDNSAFGKRNQGVYGSRVVAGQNVGAAAYSTEAAVALTSVADSGTGDKARFTLAAHGRSVGDIINITGSTGGAMDGIHRITAVPSSSTFDTDRTYVAAATAGSYKLYRGLFATMTKGDYIIRRVTDTLAGTISNTVLRSGGSEGYTRSIHKVEAARTTRFATAIRAGYWDEFNGVWTTTPTTADDLSTWGTDEAATPTYAIPGELVYRTGKPLPVQDNYKAKTA